VSCFELRILEVILIRLPAPVALTFRSNYPSLRNSIVGKAPFDTIGSVVGVSLFVLITSQLLGNVAVVQLAKPNVEVLDDKAKGKTLQCLVV
jgi:hypothetical protein